MPLLWSPLPQGQGWKVTLLPENSEYPGNLTFGMNNRGEIVGGFWDNSKKLDPRPVDTA